MTSFQPKPPRVMVVEDEFLIRLTLVEALTDEGFDVIEVDTGDAALPILSADWSIDLLLTDIQLPGRLDGKRLVDCVRKTRPELPVLFMTGRPEPVAETSDGTLDRYIAKPYTLASICSEVRRITSQTRSAV